MKRRWLVTGWLLALLSFAAWAQTPNPANESQACDCCCATQAQILCACGCEVGQLPQPAVPPTGQERLSEFAPVTLLGTSSFQTLRPTTTPVAVVFFDLPPRQHAMLAGSADWRGPPALI